MSRYTAGFIGAGNMGGIIAEAVCRKEDGKNIAVACSTAESSQRAAKKLGCVCTTPAEIAKNSRYVFLGIKPQVASEVISEIKGILESRASGGEFIIVSMMAGITIERLCGMCGTDRIIRIMPNTPSAVGEGMIQVCSTESIAESELKEFCELISEMGITDIIPEKFMDAASAVSGCGPAYAYMFIEALADGGVKCGLPRDKAITYAAQMLLGSAKLVLETKKHPEELKDAVCSPGGSTIAGVAALESGGFRACAINAVSAAYSKSEELGKK